MPSIWSTESGLEKQRLRSCHVCGSELVWQMAVVERGLQTDWHKRLDVNNAPAWVAYCLNGGHLGLCVQALTEPTDAHGNYRPEELYLWIHLEHDPEVNAADLQESVP